MTGFGAIVKSIIKALEGASSATILGLRLALGGQRPRPCPIRVESDPRRRR